MKVELAATKTNLIRTKKTLALAEEGRELLEEKRKILMNELTAVMHITDRLEFDVENALEEGYALMDQAAAAMGRRRLETLGLAVTMETDLTISQKKVMGVAIPEIALTLKENAPYYSPLDVTLYADEAAAKFREIIGLLAKLAEKRIALLRIAREVQKTIRKVNAIEKIHIPHYREMVQYIADRLEEESREAFSMLKLIKEKLRA